MIGILGGTGAVGATAAARLAAAALGEIRIGARNLERAAVVAAALPGRAVAMRVDLADADELTAFCSGCRVVVNCAGPSYRVLDRVARAALAAGADYVDAAGAAKAAAALASDAPAALDRHCAVFSAGVTPGLTGLLPRLLVSGGGVRRLDLYVGGAEALTAVSALDTLLTRGPSAGVAGAAWRDGEVARHALAPLRAVRLPGFAGPVHAWPFLTEEAQRLAAAIGAAELRAYTTYVSDRLPAALGDAWAADSHELDSHVVAVVAAAERDVAAAGSGLTLLSVARGGDACATRLVLRTADSSALSGAVVAMVVRARLVGDVGHGVSTADAVLDPAAAADALGGDPLVTELAIL